jgi:hypothetical protein
MLAVCRTLAATKAVLSPAWATRASLGRRARDHTEHRSSRGRAAGTLGGFRRKSPLPRRKAVPGLVLPAGGSGPGAARSEVSVRAAGVPGAGGVSTRAVRAEAWTRPCSCPAPSLSFPPANSACTEHWRGPRSGGHQTLPRPRRDRVPRWVARLEHLSKH